MRRTAITYKTSMSFALGISLMIHLFFLIMYFFGRDAVMPPDAPQEPSHQLRLDHLLFSFISNSVFLFLLFQANFKILQSGFRHKYLWIIVSTLFLLVSINLVFGLLKYWAYPMEEIPPIKAFVGHLIGDMFVALIVYFISQIVYLSQKRQETELENKALSEEHMKSRYEALKNQLDPHFLFNTLSSLNSMIEIDPVRAQEYVLQLSSVFRYTLQNKEIVTLEEELKFTADYCHLMQIRYGDNLIFDFRIDDSYKSYYLVPLSIQSLVENAIKHNVISKKDPLTISIKTTDNAMLTVSNPLQKKLVPEAGQGIGLANLAERYRLKWDQGIVISQKNNCFEVSIPLINSSRI